MNGHFDAGLLGRHCRLELANGGHVDLPSQRWIREPGEDDELLLTRCSGATLDIGCGPGRLTAGAILQLSRLHQASS